jgi:hypothetical protein
MQSSVDTGPSLGLPGRSTRLLSRKSVPLNRVVLADWLLAALAVLLIASPMLFTTSGFELDFTNHLWIMWVAGRDLWQAGHPSYFLNADRLGVFDPMLAFYGGSLYTIVGFCSQIIGGHPLPTYLGFTTAIIAASYGGTLWLARQLGVSRWLSHAPALTVVTSAYYVTNLYGRGDWPEFVGTAIIPLLLASGLALARSDGWRAWPLTLFVGSSVLFSGSHNITLVWGSTVIGAALLLIWIGMGRNRALPYSRLLKLAALFVACTLTNAWFLVPDVLYSGKVLVHIDVGVILWFVFDTAGNLFDPLRRVPSTSGTPALYVQLQVYFVVWSLAASVLVLRRGGVRALRGVWLAVAGLAACLLAMLMITPFWSIVPFPWNTLQFPYRIVTYVDDAVTALVVLGTLAIDRATKASLQPRATKWLRTTLVLVCAVSTAICVWQLWVPNTQGTGSLSDRSQALNTPYSPPTSWYDPGSYNDISEPIVAVPDDRTLTINPAEVNGDSFTAVASLPTGRAPIQTNIAGGPYLVHLSGLKWVGRNAQGYAVVERIHNGHGPVRISITTAHSAAIWLGRLLSLIGFVAVCVVLGLAYVRSFRRRRSHLTLTDPEGI